MTATDATRFHGPVTTGRAVGRGDVFGLEGSLFDGRFRVDRFIAEGGFALVYEAFQVALDRRVALKILKTPRAGHDGTRGEFSEKFAAEARTIARLRHRHIVDVYDFAVATLPDGQSAPWMALEWLDGETLARRLLRRREAGERGMDPRAAVELMRPALEALAHAHGCGIVHRDVKPANIMVPDERGGVLKVLDFGIAKIALDELPNTGNTRTESAPAFSPAYAAPEQVTFSRTGTWTDVHALGLILTELMTDQPPFADGADSTDVHVFEQVMAQQRPTPARHGQNVGRFEAVIARATALSPRERWRNAGELLSALDDAMADRPVPPLSSTAVEAAEAKPGVVVTARARHRGPALSLAGAAVVAALALGWTGLRRNAAGPPTASATPARPLVLPGPVASQQAPAVVPAQDRHDQLPAAAPKPPVRLQKEGPRQRAARKLTPPPVPMDGRDLFDDPK